MIPFALVDEMRSPPGPAEADMLASAESLKLLGASLTTLRRDLPAHDAFRYGAPGRALWIGYIPPPGRYAEIHAAAAAAFIGLPNSPEEHRRATELDAAYPRLVGITPETLWASTAAEAEAASAALGAPVFLKGAVKSDKEAGPEACFADGPGAARTLAARLLSSPRARGRVAIRRAVPLRSAGAAPNGFPMAHEWRVFTLHGEPLASSRYWQTEAIAAAAPAGALALAAEASRRLDVPFLAVDIAELADGDRWPPRYTVVDVGDGQFSGLCGISAFPLWARVAGAAAWSCPEEER